MKSLSLAFGFLAILAFMLAYAAMTTHPFRAELTNARTFAGCFTVGILSTLIFVRVTVVKLFKGSKSY